MEDNFDVSLKLGSNILELPLNEDTLRTWREHYDTVLGGEPLSINGKLDSKSGPRYVNCLLNPLRFPNDDAVWGVLAFGMDDSASIKEKANLLKYRTLYNQAERLLGIGSAEWDVEKGEITPYDNWMTIYGVSNERLILPELMQLAHPDDTEKIKTALEEAMSGTKPYNIEHRIVRGDDGQIRIIKSLAEVLRGVNGEPVKVYGVVQDITDMRSMQENYRANLEKYKQLYELISDAVFLIDNETGNILEANNAASTMYGYSHEELLGLKITSLSEEPEKTQCAIMHRLETIPIRYHRKKDGTVFPVEITASHYEYQEKPVHIAAIRDITGRCKAETEMERIRDLLNETQKISKIGGWEIDVNSGVVRWTDEVYRIYGLDPQTHTPREPDQGIEFFSPQNRKLLQDAFRRTLKSGKSYDLELSFKRADGQMIWVRMIGNAVLEEGKISRIRGIIMDISAVKNAEDMYTSILESIPMAVLGLNNRQILFANRDVEKVFGWKPEELVGKTTRILYRNEEEYRAIGEAIYKYLRRYNTYTSATNFFCRHKDGYDIVCRIKAAIVGDQPGNGRIVAAYEDVTDLVKTKERLGQTHEELKRALYGAIKAISTMVEAKDPYTAGHQERVRQLAVAIALELCLPEAMINNIEIASILHDVGKIHVPTDLLVKPSKLSELEFALIKNHAEVGYRIVKDIALPENVAEAVYQHHEALDGSGYPRGLYGDQIIMEARVISVADVVEAMSSHRPYRPALGTDAALKEIRRQQGLLYDPQVVAACQTLFEKKEFSWYDAKNEISMHFLHRE